MDEKDLWNDLSTQLEPTTVQPDQQVPATHFDVNCSQCDGMTFSYHNGKRVCEECGAFSEDIIDQGAEWRCFSSAQGKDNSSVRCSDARSPFVPDTLSVNTFIRDGDRRLQRVHHFSHTSAKERLFSGIHKDFEDITLKHELPRVIYKTMCELYFKVFTAMQERNYAFQRCNIRKGLIAACLFYACKMNGNPRNYKEIADMLGFPRKWVTKGCNNFTDVLGQEYINLPPFKPSDFVERFCTALSLEFNVQSKVRETVVYVENQRLVHESTPSSVAASVLYNVVSLLKPDTITVESVSKACEVSKTVINKLNLKLDANNIFVDFVGKYKMKT
jgi:transcription initiation factor TFIIB